MFESTIFSGQIHLGKQGEHCARRFSFQDVEIWKEIFGEGRCELLHQRNGDEAPYPVVLTIENGVPYWYVSEVDTAFAGMGKCEVRYVVDDTIVKSNIYITIVQESLGEGTTEPPEPQKAWVEQVLEASSQAEQSANDAKKYAEDSSKSAEEAAGNVKFIKEATDGINTSFANALKGVVNGTGVVKIDDLSPLPHNIAIKTDVATSFKSYGKNLINYDVNKGLANWEQDGSSSIYYIYFDIPCDVVMTTQKWDGTVYIQKSNDGFKTVSNVGTINTNKPLNITKEDGYTYRVRANLTTINSNSIQWLQVEVGNATEYEPYKEPVNGVNLVYPVTTLVADVPGVQIEATYNRDINKAFAELTAAIISLGGNV